MAKNSPSRGSQAKLNIAVSIMYQVVAAVIGLILPRFILSYYGSEINGMVQSVNQFLGYTAILECGIGGMVVSSFYKPLAQGDERAVSDIFNNTKSFFKKMSLIYCGLVVLLTCFAGFIIRTEFDFLYISLMVVILGVSNYFSYYFAMPQRLLLRADQKLRIQQLFQAAAIIVNAVVCVVLIINGAKIHTVKFAGAVVFLITPVALRLYVKKHYKISKKIYDHNRTYPEKKDGIAHHVSFFIHNNTDIVVLTLFCGVKEVSVYSVYNSVVVAISNLMGAVSSGIAATVGNIIALDEKENLKKTFEIYSTVNAAVSTFCCVCFSLLLLPFVTVYTSGVTDINYIRPIFAYLLIATQWIYFLRIPYTTAITSAGHYKQTKWSAVIEASLNVCVSLVFVKFYGVTGVITGTFFAMVYRTAYTVWYLSKNIMYRKIMRFVVDLTVNACVGLPH